MEKKCRKKYDSEDSKRRLLKAALDIFAKEGYEAATTRAIAKKAGVNDSLIQRYFEGKLGLLVALSEGFRDSALRNATTPVQDSLEAELQTFFTNKLKFAKDHRKLFKIILTQSLVNSDFRAQITRISKDGTPGLVANLTDLQRRKKIDKNLNVAALSGAVNTLSMGFSLILEILDIMEPGYDEQLIPLMVKLLSQGMK